MLDEVAASLGAVAAGLGARLHRLVRWELLAFRSARFARLRARLAGGDRRRAVAALGTGSAQLEAVGAQFDALGVLILAGSELGGTVLEVPGTLDETVGTRLGTVVGMGLVTLGLLSSLKAGQPREAGNRQWQLRPRAGV